MSNTVFDIRTISLLAGIIQAIVPPRACKAVTIFSGASTTVYLYSDASDDTTALPIAAGWNQPLELPSGGMFLPGQTSFSLKCSVNATVYLLWT